MCPDMDVPAPVTTLCTRRSVPRSVFFKDVLRTLTPNRLPQEGHLWSTSLIMAHKRLLTGFTPSLENDHAVLVGLEEG